MSAASILAFIEKAKALGSDDPFAVGVQVEMMCRPDAFSERTATAAFTGWLRANRADHPGETFVVSEAECIATFVDWLRSSRASLERCVAAPINRKAMYLVQGGAL